MCIDNWEERRYLYREVRKETYGVDVEEGRASIPAICGYSLDVRRRADEEDQGV